MSTHYSGRAVMLMARIKRALATHGIYLSLSDNVSYSAIQRQCAEVEDKQLSDLLVALRSELGLADTIAV